MPLPVKAQFRTYYTHPQSQDTNLKKDSQQSRVGFHSSDLFFKGKTEATSDFTKLMKQGKTAAEALIYVLHNSNLDKEIKDILLNGVEGAVPFLKAASEAPGFFASTEEILMRSHKLKLKNAAENFIKNPSLKHLKEWKKTQNNPPWWNPGYIGEDMYTEAFHTFRDSSDYLINRSSPDSIGQKELEAGIRLKNTAIASTFLFNNDFVAGYGRNALINRPDRYDPVVALKVLDLNKSKFSSNEINTFYKNLVGVTLDYFTLWDQDINKVLMIRAHIKSNLSSSQEDVLKKDANHEVKELLDNSEEYIKTNYKTMFTEYREVASATHCYMPSRYVEGRFLKQYYPIQERTALAGGGSINDIYEIPYKYDLPPGTIDPLSEVRNDPIPSKKFLNFMNTLYQEIEQEAEITGAQKPKN